MSEMGPGMPNPNSLRAAQGEYSQQLQKIEEAIPRYEGAIAQLRAGIAQYEAALNNPQVPPEQKAQILREIESMRQQLAEYEAALENMKRSRMVLRSELMKITGYLAAMNRAKAQQQQQQQAVHAEGSSNRG